MFDKYTCLMYKHIVLCWKDVFCLMLKLNSLFNFCYYEYYCFYLRWFIRYIIISNARESMILWWLVSACSVMLYFCLGCQQICHIMSNDITHRRSYRWTYTIYHLFMIYDLISYIIWYHLSCMEYHMIYGIKKRYTLMYNDVIWYTEVR